MQYAVAMIQVAKTMTASRRALIRTGSSAGLGINRSGRQAGNLESLILQGGREAFKVAASPKPPHPRPLSDPSPSRGRGEQEFAPDCSLASFTSLSPLAPPRERGRGWGGQTTIDADPMQTIRPAKRAWRGAGESYHRDVRRRSLLRKSACHVSRVDHRQ